MPDLKDFGTKVEVDLVNTNFETVETIEGWFLGETPRGLYLALDPDANVVRLLPRGTWGRIFYQRDVGKAPFVAPDYDQKVEAIETLARELEEPVGAALDRVDHNRIKRLAATIHDTKARLEEYRSEEYRYRPINVSQLPPYEHFVTARNTHAEVLDEVRRSGLEGVLREHTTSLRQVISRDTLPQMDAQVVSPAELDEMIRLTRDRDLLSETDFGRQWVYQPVTINIQVGGTLPQPPAESMTSEQEPDHMRSVTGWIKVLSGSALVVTNIGAGIVAGIVFGLPTLGWGTVPIALGVAGSVHTGLTGAASAFQDIHTPPKQ